MRKFIVITWIIMAMILCVFAYLGVIPTTLEALKQHGWIVILLMFIVRGFLFFPSLILLSCAAGFLYGFKWGVCISLTGVTVNAMMSFYIFRAFGEEYLDKIRRKSKSFQRGWDLVEEKFQIYEEQNGIIIAILKLRLCPFILFDVLNGFLAFTFHISAWQYFWGAFLGMFPWIIIYVFSGYYPKVTSIIVVFYLLILVIQFYIKRWIHK